MLRKVCALCSRDIEESEEPAVLFVGKYGRRYEICANCEGLMDTFVSSEIESDRTGAAKRIYDHLFHEGVPKSAELLDFFKDLFSENGRLVEAQDLLCEYAEEEAAALTDEEDVTPVPAAEENAIPTEEEFLASDGQSMPVISKILFLLLFLLLGGGTVFYGIVSSTISLIVVGAIVALIGVGMVFSK